MIKKKLTINKNEYKTNLIFVHNDFNNRKNAFKTKNIKKKKVQNKNYPF